MITYKRLSPEEDKQIAKMYINDKKSSTELGVMFGVSHRTILNHLESMGIERRELNESHFAHNKKDYPEEFTSYQTMYDLYVIQHMTKEQLGVRFNCAPHVIDRVLKNLNIHVRNASEAKIGIQSGPEHHNWKGGVTPLYNLCREYFSTNLSPKVRERDGYRCQMCGSNSNLHVHHIVPLSQILDEILNEHSDLSLNTDKDELYNIITHDQRFLNLDNLITYCNNCHLYKIHNYNKTIRSEASKEERSTTIA